MENRAFRTPSPPYVSAQQSPSEYFTPPTVSSPPSAPALDTSSRIPKIDLEQAFTQLSGSLPPVTSPAEVVDLTTYDIMPPVTRSQNRAGVDTSELSSSPQFRARSTSPITSENVLRDASPHSKSYASQLESGVERVERDLGQRERTREAQALRTLYNQSFKDAGSRVLLDALLRNRLSDRQKRDFKRYVQDVSLLGSSASKAAVPARSPETSVLGKRRRSKRASAGTEDGSDDIESEGGIVLPGPSNPLKEVAALDAASPLSDTLLDQESSSGQAQDEPQADASETGEKSQKRREANDEGHVSTVQASPSLPLDAGTAEKRKRAKRRIGAKKGKKQSVGERAGEASAERGPGATWSTSDSPLRKIGDAEVRETAGLDDATRQSEAHSMNIPPLSALQGSRRFRKNERRMFRGADGPVYMSNLLGLGERR